MGLEYSTQIAHFPSVVEHAYANGIENIPVEIAQFASSPITTSQRQSIDEL
jgi:hypothetical protein